MIITGENDMATNDYTVRAMEHMIELIDELNAYKATLVRHAGQQKRQMHKSTWIDYYDKTNKKVIWLKVNQNE